VVHNAGLYGGEHGLLVSASAHTRCKSRVLTVRVSATATGCIYTWQLPETPESESSASTIPSYDSPSATTSATGSQLTFSVTTTGSSTSSAISSEASTGLVECGADDEGDEDEYEWADGDDEDENEDGGGLSSTTDTVFGSSATPTPSLAPGDLFAAGPESSASGTSALNIGGNLWAGGDG
jgi:hypothetical protein